jgi:arsenate reductase
LERAHLSTSGLRSKSWDEFAGEDAPQLDFIVTVCDHAAKEVCPVWPGHPVTAHWDISDPARVRGTQEQVEEAYREAFFRLERRIGLFLGLPFAILDRLSLKTAVEKIGHK